jgi:hypothetical protein
LNSNHDNQLLNAASDGEINMEEAVQRSASVDTALPLLTIGKPDTAGGVRVAQLPAAVAAHLFRQCTSLADLVSGRLAAHYSPAAMEQALKAVACNIQGALHGALPQLRVGGKSPSLANQQAVLRRILLTGRLQSQFETGDSGGAYNPDFRAAREAELFGYPLKLPAIQRPIYGYLASAGYEPALVRQYGVFGIRLHSHVLARTTLTATDSLDYMTVATGFFEASAAAFVSTWPGLTRTLLARMAQAPLSLADLERPYVEAQFHNGVRLCDIESVLVYQQDHLPADLVALCKQHNIAVVLFPH